MSDATPSGDWSRSAAAQRQYNLVGGAILAVAGLILLATSFLLQNPVPLTVRGSVVIFTAVGIAIPAGLLRVQNPQDVYGGMALILLSLVAFVASNDLRACAGLRSAPAPRRACLRSRSESCRSVLWSAASGRPGPQVSGYKIRGRHLYHRSDPRICRVHPAARSGHRELCNDDHLRGGGGRREVARDLACRDFRHAFCSVLFPYGLNLPFQLWPRFW